MQMRAGYELTYDCPQPTPMVLMLNIHHARANDLIVPDRMLVEPFVPIASYRDGFGNWCSRIVAPKGRLRLSANAVLNDTGATDPICTARQQHPVESLPAESLVFLLGSRYCETDRLTEVAWDPFGSSPTGAPRIQAICDYVHHHITLGYEHARPTRTAWEVLSEQRGVCRDFAHLAVALCRCMNIPARYCFGYVSDIGLPPPYALMDFAAWFEAYIDGAWYTFDLRNNAPRIGRVLIAQGRDAADVAISNTFGPNTLTSFKVWVDALTVPLTGVERAGSGQLVGRSHGGRTIH